MTSPPPNTDENEAQKFDSLAGVWWDPDGPLHTLHDINPVRLSYITGKTPLAGRKILDIGCGAGLLTESMAAKNARVTGIDISEALIIAAARHAQAGKLSIHYQVSTPEQFAGEYARQFDVVTCMEILEHVPDPSAVVAACARLVKPGGQVFFSTINRTIAAYLFAVIGAEQLFRLLPAGTHDYAKFIRPSELAAWCRQEDLMVKDIAGMHYFPLLRRASLSKHTGINYLLHANYH